MSQDQMYFQTAPVSELCDCVGIELTDSESGRLSRARSQEQRERLMKVFFESGRDRSYDENCPDCDAGIIHQ